MKAPLKLLLFLDSLVLFAGAMLAPLYTVFVLDRGGSFLAAAASWGMLGITAGLVTLFLIHVEDRLKETEIAIALGYFILALGFYGYLLVEGAAALIFDQMLVGLGLAIATPAYGAVFFKHLTKKSQPFGWSVRQGLTYIVLGAGSLVGGVVITLGGFGVVFMIMGTLALLSAVAILALPRRLL